MKQVAHRVLPLAADALRVHHRALAIRFFGVLALLLLFGALSDNVLDREKVLFDAPVLAYLHRIASPALDELMLFFTRTGDWRGVIPADCVIFAILLWRGRRHAATFWVFAVGGAALINLAAKAFLARTRPEPWLSMAPETTFSFPSGHAMGSMASVTALVILLWPTAWRWPAIVLGVLFVLGVGISRPYLGVHYPSDIVAGWAASLAWVLGINTLLFHLGRRRASREV